MGLADELAAVCVAATEKRAEGVPDRNAFETSVGREELLRRHAERLQELSKARAVEEDTTPGGYAETFAKRLVPVPHTTGEAAVRLPAMLLGGMYGSHVARPYETPSADVIHKVLAAPRVTVGAMPGMGGDLGGGMARQRTGNIATRLTTYLEEAKNPEAEASAKKLVQWLSTQRPELVAGALQPRPLPLFDRSKSHAIRSKLEQSLGEGGIPFLRREINLLGEPEAKSMASRLGRLRWGGAAAGGLAAGALAGIPFAIKALLQKKRGGEAAVRAQEEARQAIEGAEQEQTKREDLLKGVSV
jgi:hypothetical protein